MSLEEKIRLMMAIDSLIKRKVPGNAADYAGRLNISRSTFFRLLQYMRTELKVPITHDKVRNRYLYQEDGRLYFGFVRHDKDCSKGLNN